MEQVKISKCMSILTCILAVLILSLSSCSNSELLGNEPLKSKLADNRVVRSTIYRTANFPVSFMAIGGDTIMINCMLNARPILIKTSDHDANKALKQLELAYFNRLVVKVVTEHYMLKSIDFAEPSDTVSPRKYESWTFKGMSNYLCETNKDSLIIPWKEYELSLSERTDIDTSLIFIPDKFVYDTSDKQFVVTTKDGDVISFKTTSADITSLSRMLTVAVREHFFAELKVGTARSARLRLKDALYQTDDHHARWANAQKLSPSIMYQTSQDRQKAIEAFQEIMRHCIKSITSDYKFPTIPLFNTDNGCEARAHAMSYILKKKV